MVSVPELLKPIAIKHNGVITVRDARDAGVSPEALRRWASRDPDVDSSGYGVYVWWLDDERIDWSILPLEKAYARAGRDAVLAGKSVIEYKRLGTIGNEPFTFIVPKRKRRREGYRFIVGRKPSKTTTTKGIPSTTVRQALWDTKGSIDGDKWEEIVTDAAQRRYIDDKEKDALLTR